MTVPRFKIVRSDTIIHSVQFIIKLSIESVNYRFTGLAFPIMVEQLLNSHCRSAVLTFVC